jgi:hypothetical protein
MLMTRTLGQVVPRAARRQPRHSAAAAGAALARRAARRQPLQVVGADLDLAQAVGHYGRLRQSQSYLHNLQLKFGQGP